MIGVHETRQSWPLKRGCSQADTHGRRNARSRLTEAGGPFPLFVLPPYSPCCVDNLHRCRDHFAQTAPAMGPRTRNARVRSHRFRWSHLTERHLKMELRRAERSSKGVWMRLRHPGDNKGTFTEILSRKTLLVSTLEMRTTRLMVGPH